MAVSLEEVRWGPDQALLGHNRRAFRLPFEKMVVDRLASRGMANDYLANINDKSGAYPTPAEIRRVGITQAFDGVLDAVEKELAAKGGTIPELPPVDPKMVDDGPKVGDEWDGPKGVSHITGRDGSKVEVTAPDGTTVDMEFWQAETLMAEHAFALTDEGKAEAERKAKAAASSAAKHENRSALQDRADDLSQGFARAKGKSVDCVRGQLAKSYNFSGDMGVMSRAGIIVDFVENRNADIKGDGKRAYRSQKTGTKPGQVHGTREGRRGQR